MRSSFSASTILPHPELVEGRTLRLQPPVRQLLPQGLNSFPRVLVESAQALRQVLDGEVVGADRGAELVPGERGRDGGARTRPRRVSADGGGAHAVADVVDVDAP